MDQISETYAAMRADYDDACEAVHDGRAMWLPLPPRAIDFDTAPCDGCELCETFPPDMSDRWTPPVTPAPTLPERLRIEIESFRRMGDDYGDLIAERLVDLLTVVNALNASTVEDYRDRRDTLLGSL